MGNTLSTCCLDPRNAVRRSKDIYSKYIERTGASQDRMSEILSKLNVDSDPIGDYNDLKRAMLLGETCPTDLPTQSPTSSFCYRINIYINDESVETVATVCCERAHMLLKRIRGISLLTVARKCMTPGRIFLSLVRSSKLRGLAQHVFLQCTATVFLRALKRANPKFITRQNLFGRGTTTYALIVSADRTKLSSLCTLTRTTIRRTCLRKFCLRKSL